MQREIKIHTHWWELYVLEECMKEYPPGGNRIEAMFCESILKFSVAQKLASKTLKLRHEPNEKKRMKTVNWTLLNHEARAIAYYCTLLVSGNHLVNDHDRSCLDFLRNKLLQKLA